ncbi:ATP-binding protein [Clostridium sp. AF35-15]|jgi:predicted AAA+ superfamily ATPase|uniref:ATP-binding protein n=1 Tax=Clostridium TaxID=1485 RepID=UPI000E52A080|nr:MULTISPECIES: ATP-binding protein [Clostridium]RHP17024.1 ATP-binding protein [Clostridium sp. AF35-15]RHS40716.1 ATP-binding protein [Clostridium sp. AF02-29]
MERELFTKLERWMNKKNRKPLIIQGARQVGKTWIMKEFGARFYENTVYINFDNNKAMKDVFDLDFDLKRILSAIKIEYGKSFQAENTLIIFDEIQEAPKALASLKYFYENAPQYSIIAAGSLLGVALHQGTSFPVGKVDFLKLCPMSFNEFILAVGEKGLHEALRSQDYELINAYAGKYTDLLKKYYYVGGMPEVVQTYIDSDDLFEVREIQNNLLQYYEEDFSKHAPKEVVPRIMMVWNSIPSQLAKENRKFMYGALREGARAKDFELAIQWLEDAGLILKSYRVSKPDIPLIAYMEMNSFKMFMFDVGLLTAKTGLSARLLLEGSRIFEEFKGALTEQYVAQELHAAGYPLYYFATARSTGEIDFMLQGDLDCVPIEVKAEQNLRARSLRAFCDKYKPGMAIRSSMSNYKQEDWLTNVPLYMLAEYLKRTIYVVS